MSEQPVVYDYETVSGYLNYFADLAEISDKGGRIEELLELTGLARHREKKLSQYSKGMLQRLNLARALLNDPDLLIMDEPVIGLDPLGQDLIEKVVISRKKAGKAVFINTHAVSFAAKMADRVGFLMGGRLKKIFNREEFEKGTFPYVYEISCPNDEVYEKFLAEFEMKEKEELMARFVVKDVDESEKLLNMIVSTSSRILHVAANQEVLEKAFLEYSADLSLEDRAR
jgi:ABC-type multidrug transport system ATPase subunit